MHRRKGRMKGIHRKLKEEGLHSSSLGKEPPYGTNECIPLKRHSVSRKKPVIHSGVSEFTRTEIPVSRDEHSLYYYQASNDALESDSLGEDLKVVLSELCHREVADYYLRQTL
jgi:hypothetical protein